MLIKIVEIKYYDALTMPDFFLRYTLRRKIKKKKRFSSMTTLLHLLYILYIYIYVCMPIYICLSVKYECFLQPSEIWQIIHILTFPKKPLFTSFLSRFIFICLFVCFIFMSIMSIMALAFFSSLIIQGTSQ